MKLSLSNMRSLLLLISVLTLAGCGAGLKYASHKVNDAEFCAKNKAIVITKVYGRHKPLIGCEREYRAGYALAKVDSNYCNLHARHRYKIREASLVSPEYDILMIEPGEYVIEEICYTFGDTIYTSSAEGYIPGTGQAVYAKFTVKPNEIVYLGDLDIMPKQTGRPTKVLNSCGQAEKYFYKKYPNLAQEKITNRNYITCENLLPVSLFKETIIQTQTVYVYM